MRSKPNPINAKPIVKELPCAECNAILQLEMPDKPKIVNSAELSILVLDHPKPIECDNCGAVFAFGINESTMPMVDLRVVRGASRRILMPGEAGNVNPLIQ
jgi:hypothetical protein